MDQLYILGVVTPLAFSSSMCTRKVVHRRCFTHFGIEKCVLKEGPWLHRGQVLRLNRNRGVPHYLRKVGACEMLRYVPVTGGRAFSRRLRDAILRILPRAIDAFIYCLRVYKDMVSWVSVHRRDYLFVVTPHDQRNKLLAPRLALSTPVANLAQSCEGVFCFYCVHRCRPSAVQRTDLQE